MKSEQNRNTARPPPLYLLPSHLDFHFGEEHHDGVHDVGGEVGVLWLAVTLPSTYLSEHKLDEDGQRTAGDCIAHHTPLVVIQISLSCAHPLPAANKDIKNKGVGKRVLGLHAAAPLNTTSLNLTIYGFISFFLMYRSYLHLLHDCQ